MIVVLKGRTHSWTPPPALRHALHAICAIVLSCVAALSWADDSTMQTDDRPVILRPGIADVDVTFGDFLHCVQNGNFPAEAGPRKVTVSEDGLVETVVNGTAMALDFVLDPDAAFLLALEANGRRSEQFRDKIQIVRIFLLDCPER